MLLCLLYGFDYRDIYELTDFWEVQYFDSELPFQEEGIWIAIDTIQYLLESTVSTIFFCVIAKTLDGKLFLIIYERFFILYYRTSFCNNSHLIKGDIVINPSSKAYGNITEGYIFVNIADQQHTNVLVKHSFKEILHQFVCLGLHFPLFQFVRNSSVSPPIRCCEF